jgi:hypothetical protein
MTTNKIYVDTAHQGPATLRRVGRSVNCQSLEEAVMAWHRLAATEREQATIKVNVPGGNGPVYSVKEIDRLHYGAKPK